MEGALAAATPLRSLLDAVRESGRRCSRVETQALSPLLKHERIKARYILRAASSFGPAWALTARWLTSVLIVGAATEALVLGPVGERLRGVLPRA